ncbi:MAG: endonuclease III [Candidatus Eisenbacteria bacterium]|nr:endonuclease III [Candidatus Latescibacterota bacterium]MBD3302406.1 endonuclease III [Candidatus Eisenbacteria bacterium]
MARKREADRSLKRDAGWFHRRLARAYPDAACTLDYETPLDLYVATVLSAQCTDARVNQVTPALFRTCRRAEDYLRLGREELERRIQSTGFFRSKAKHILGAGERLVAVHGGRIPQTMEELLALPGVGRKTANVILGNAFGKQEGIVVDTHVGRVSRRLGLTRQTDPVKVERDLMELFPRKDWTVLSHRMILHGRNVCLARSPRCAGCTLSERCAYAAG